MSPDRVLTVQQAARLASLDVSTVKRDRLSGKYPGAFQTASGEWRIPLQDLVEAGRWTPPAGQDPVEAADVATVQAALVHEVAAHVETAARLAVAEALLEAERRHNAQLLTLATASCGGSASGAA